jgi:hypothetical protein
MASKTNNTTVKVEGSTQSDVEACLKEQDERPFRNYYFCRVCLYPHGEGNWEAQCEPCVNCEVPDVVWQFQAQDEEEAAILAEKCRLRRFEHSER